MGKFWKQAALILALALPPAAHAQVDLARLDRDMVGESVNFQGGLDWLREAGVEVVDLQDERCIRMLGDWIAANPEVWNEDIGE